jgi:hypothetical protein
MHFVKRLSLWIVAPFAALQDALAMASINVVLFVSGFDESLPSKRGYITGRVRLASHLI